MIDRDTVDALPVGVYRLYWTDGCSSVASVGVNRAGRHWYAPANWITVPWFDWTKVERVELIERNYPECDG